MRRTDIWFFGVIISMFMIVFISLFVDDPNTGFIGHMLEYGVLYSIGLLIPYIFIKFTYLIFPQFKLNTKFFNWLEIDLLKSNE